MLNDYWYVIGGEKPRENISNFTEAVYRHGLNRYMKEKIKGNF